MSYGIRFYSKASESIIPLWSETDTLNHRPATGESENVQVNLQQMIELNTGKIFDFASSMTVYAERSASNQVTAFSLQIGKFEFLDYQLTSARLPGSYHAIYVGLSQIQPNPSLTLTTVQIQARLNGSLGTVFVPYFIQGLAAYSGSVYSVTTIPMDLSTSLAISLGGQKLFSDNLPLESAAIVVVAASGTLIQMLLESTSLNYFSRTAENSSPVSNGRASYVDDLFFMILLPSSVIVLIYGRFRKAKLARKNL